MKAAVLFPHSCLQGSPRVEYAPVPLTVKMVAMLPYVLVIIAGMNLLFGVPVLVTRNSDILHAAMPHLKVETNAAHFRRGYVCVARSVSR